MRSAALYCEGYHDRAFLAGWLARRGWTDPGALPNGKRKPVAHPRRGTVVTGGRFAFCSPGGACFAEVVPCEGDGSVIAEAVGAVARAPDGVDDVIIVIDADVDDAEDGPRPRWQALGRAMREVKGLSAEQEGETFRMTSGMGEARLHLLVWTAPTPATRLGVPPLHTLERVVCSAIADAHGDRAEAVDTWLRSRPGAAALTAKAFSWSHMAGWYAEHGCEAFLREAIWRDTGVAAALVETLQAAGCTEVLERVERALPVTP